MWPQLTQRFHLFLLLTSFISLTLCEWLWLPTYLPWNEAGTQLKFGAYIVTWGMLTRLTLSLFNVLSWLSISRAFKTSPQVRK